MKLLPPTGKIYWDEFVEWDIKVNKMKSYTDIEQSKKLADILPIESADMYWWPTSLRYYIEAMDDGDFNEEEGHVRAWSLAALLNILHSRGKDIPSLSGGGYKDGEYISDWCLDYEFENGDYQKTFADNPVDACVAMIELLHEQKLL